MKSISAVVIVVIVLLAGAYLYRPVYVTPAEAQSEFRFAVTVYSLANEGDSGECFPDGVSNLDVSQPWRQVIVTNAEDVTVGYVDIREGEYTEIEGNAVCAIRTNLTVKDSPFYTLAIDGAYQRTVSPHAIEAFGGEVFIQVS